MIDVNIRTYPHFYGHDIDPVYDYLSDLDDSQFSYPDNTALFHIYSDIKSEKELLSVQSYLATQNLSKTRLILWSDLPQGQNPLLDPYRNLIELRHYDVNVEAKDTLLHDFKHLKVHDKRFYLKSDLFRLLIIHKYGGTYVDMDMVLLRDFKPLLNQPYVYQWGDQTDHQSFGPCASIFSGLPNSPMTHRALEWVRKIKPHKNSTAWGKDLFKELLKEAQDLWVLPGAFFNIEWQEAETKIPHNSQWWFSNERKDLARKHLFLNCFSWHWHNSTNKKRPIEPFSKFHLLQELVTDRLKERGIL